MLVNAFWARYFVPPIVIAEAAISPEMPHLIQTFRDHLKDILIFISSFAIHV